MSLKLVNIEILNKKCTRNFTSYADFSSRGYDGNKRNESPKSALATPDID